MSLRTIGRLIGGALVIFVLIIAASSSNYVVQPGYRGVQVTLGKVSPVFKPEGFGFKLPFISAVVPQSIRQQTAKFEADCYSSDLQQAKTEASTAVIKARGEAESINLRGKALRDNPGILELQIVERWDGITPLVVGPGAAGANMLLPLGNLKTAGKATDK